VTDSGTEGHGEGGSGGGGEMDQPVGSGRDVEGQEPGEISRSFWGSVELSKGC
jgi:hypothetical protein